MSRKNNGPLYMVIKDTREQRGWDFPASPSCAGTELATLPTGDYTLVGYQNLFVIERKRNMAEFCMNLFDKRFDRELERLDDFPYPYLILEFTMREIINFPVGSNIPENKWAGLRITPQVLLKRFHEVQIQHPTLRVILAGVNGREVASSLFKRIVEHHA